MSNEALAWAFKTKLRTTQKFVLVALADYADDDHSCYPSYKLTAQRIGASVSTVRRAIESLESDGYVRVSKRYGDDGKQTSNRYVLNVGFWGCQNDTPIEGAHQMNSTPAHQMNSTPAHNSEQHPCSPMNNKPLEEPLDKPSTKPVGAQSAPKGHRVPDEFMPAQKHIDKIRQLKPNLNLDIEHTKFMNYWLSATGAKATKRDWGRTWENWMLDAREDRSAQDYKPGWQRRLEYNTTLNRQYQADPGAEFLRSLEQ